MKPYDSPTGPAGGDDRPPGRSDHNPADCRSCTEWNDVAGECSVEPEERRRLCGWRPPRSTRTRQPDWPLFAGTAERSER